jgi:hypothetical protein
MKTKALSVLIALLVSSLAFGQDYTFKVLVNKGKNEVKSGSTNWVPLKVGTSLKSVDELKVSENSYVGLIHVTGKPLELKDAKTYKVIDLSARVGTGTSVLNKYTDFILSNNQKKTNLNATGAVHRGPDKIAVYLPVNSSYIYSDTVSIEWEKDKGKNPPYEVTFTNLFGDELLKVETSENNVTVNLAGENFARENDITVKVFSKKDRKESDAYTLRKFSKADKEKVKATYNETEAFTRAKTPLNRYYRAAFFEQNKLLADAATAFQQAVKMEPLYKEDYENFLVRTGLKILPKGK